MVNVINEIISQLREIPEFNLVSIWNNQFNYMDEGEIYSFPMPCAFVEISADDFEILGDNYQATDLNVKIHIGNDFYNGSNIDENLAIFVLRDLVIKKLTYFTPVFSGQFYRKSEKQDFNHSNVYHYEIDFKTHYVDSTAVRPKILSTPPTALQINK